MYRWIIYGIVEPNTRKIVYIDFYIEDTEEKYYTELNDKDFLEVSLDSMRDEKNPYRIDLINMWNEGIQPYNNDTGIVILDILEDDKEIIELINAYRKLFKPKYCIGYYNNSKYTWRLDKENCKDKK